MAETPAAPAQPLPSVLGGAAAETSSTTDARVNRDTASVVVDATRVSFVLPEGAKPDPTLPPPDVTVTVRQGWYASACCKIVFAAQKVEPLYPAEELISVVESGGLTWSMYDTGPRDLSTIDAVARTVDGTWLAIIVQRFAPDVEIDTVSVVEEVLASVKVEGRP